MLKNCHPLYTLASPHGSPVMGNIFSWAVNAASNTWGESQNRPFPGRLSEATPGSYLQGEAGLHKKKLKLTTGEVRERDFAGPVQVLLVPPSFVIPETSILLKLKRKRKSRAVPGGSNEKSGSSEWV